MQDRDSALEALLGILVARDREMHFAKLLVCGRRRHRAVVLHCPVAFGLGGAYGRRPQRHYDRCRRRERCSLRYHDVFPDKNGIGGGRTAQPPLFLPKILQIWMARFTTGFFLSYGRLMISAKHGGFRGTRVDPGVWRASAGHHMPRAAPR